MLNCISILRTCSARDWYSDITRPLRPPEGLPRAQHFLSGTPSKIFCVPISTRVHPTDFFHERLQLRRWHLAISDYRDALAHLLVVLLSALSSLVQRIMAVNGSAFLSKGSSANSNARRRSFLVLRRTLQ
jgi:hypothetical protein